MEEILEFSRLDVCPATLFRDEATGALVTVTTEEAEPFYNRFVELRSNLHYLQETGKVTCISIGMILKEYQDRKIYQFVGKERPFEIVQGYSSFFKFCEEVLGIKKKTAQRYISVASAFGCEEGKVRIEYANYSFRQLTELLNVEEKYRLRIPTSMSTRDIHRLSDFYKEHVPSNDKLAEDDLKDYYKWHKQQQEEKNSKKNSINFVPANPSKSSLDSMGSARTIFENGAEEDADYDGEDERNISTVETKPVDFEDVRKGLLRLIELLRQSRVGYNKFCDLFQYALLNDRPTSVGRVKDFAEAFSQSEKGYIKQIPPTGRLTFKNDKERREWFDNYHSWGVWIDVPELSLTYYRYDFANGCYIIVEEGYEHYFYTKPVSLVIKRAVDIVDPEKDPHFNVSFPGGVSAVVSWLSKHKNEI